MQRNKIKEEAVRKALGVERTFEVILTIPMTGNVQLSPMRIKALDEADAKGKAIELVLDGGYDLDGQDALESETFYDYDSDTNWWSADIEEEDDNVK